MYRKNFSKVGLVTFLLAALSLPSFADNTVINGTTSGGQVKPILVGSDGTLQTSSSGGGSSTVAQSDQTLLKGTMYQGGTWSSVGVTGTFWQSVQPVSGTFWQTTQPISGIVTIVPSIGTLTDRSGSITAGGTAQQICASNSTRKYLLIQNTSSVDMWISFTTTTPTVAGAGCYKIAAGGSYESSAAFVTSQSCYVFCATTSSSYSASEN